MALVDGQAEEKAAKQKELEEQRQLQAAQNSKMLAETKAKDELAVHFRQEYDDMEDEGFLQQRYSIYWGI